MTVGELIELIGPLNNRFRETDGIDRIETLWEIGDILQKATTGSLEDLLWDIQSRSFITRDLLRYSSIIRRGWPDQGGLRSEFGDVSSYSLFREALPFLKGDREGIDGETYSRVVKIVTGNNHVAAREYLRKLKRNYIGRQHQEGVSKAKVDQHVQAFLAFITELGYGLGADPVGTVAGIRAAYGQSLPLMGKILYALATGGAIPSNALQDLRKALSHPLIAPAIAASAGSREERSAFVKAVTANLLMEMTDLFVALRTDESIAQFLKKPHISFQIGVKHHG